MNVYVCCLDTPLSVNQNRQRLLFEVVEHRNMIPCIRDRLNLAKVWQRARVQMEMVVQKSHVEMLTKVVEGKVLLCELKPSLNGETLKFSA